MEINAIKKVRQWDMKEVAGTGLLYIPLSKKVSEEVMFELGPEWWEETSHMTVWGSCARRVSLQSKGLEPGRAWLVWGRKGTCVAGAVVRSGAVWDETGHCHRHFFHVLSPNFWLGTWLSRIKRTFFQPFSEVGAVLFKLLFFGSLAHSQTWAYLTQRGRSLFL